MTMETTYGRILLTKIMDVVNEEKIDFKDAYGTDVSMGEVVDQIIEFAKAAPQYKYEVVVGTDSEAVNDRKSDLVTAVVVRRVGNGGRYFWRRFSGGPFHTLRNRIIEEVMTSLEAAQLVLKAMSEALAGTEMNFHFEVHADIGEKGETREMMQEVTGMIRAHNFDFCVKPGSYAASAVADRHV